MNSRAFFTYGTVAMLGIAGGVAIGPILGGLLALSLIIVVCACGVTLVYIALDMVRMIVSAAIHRTAPGFLPIVRRPSPDA